MALTFPSSPSNGQIYTDTVTGYRYSYNSSAGVWSFAANSVGMSVSSTPPSNVAPGSMWFNREIGRTFVYYDDGDSKQWIETVPATGSFDGTLVSSYANTAATVALTPAYNTANAGFAKANTALQNTSGFFDGSLAFPPSSNISLGSATTGRLILTAPTGDGTVKVSGNGTDYAALSYIGGSYAYVGTLSNTPFYFVQNNTMRMQLLAGGNVKLASGIKVLNDSGNPILQQTGSILQVVTAFDSGTSTTSAGWTNTGLTASITPTSSSSKILVLVTWTGRTSSTRMGHRITRGATVIEGQNESLGVIASPQRMFTHYLDSPASTSSQTYTLQIYQPNGGNTIQTNDTGTNQGLNPHNEITLIEIAA